MAIAPYPSRGVEGPGNETLNDHVKTYRTFVRSVFLFVPHVAAILAVMGYFLT